MLYVVAAVPSALAQLSFAIEAVGAPPSPIRAMLEPNGTRLLTIVNGNRIPICEIFWSKIVATHKEPRKLRDVVYPELSPGAYLGILSLHEDFLDFDRNKLEPGFYTMRYARIVQQEKQQEDEDGDEEESRPRVTGYRDAVLLSRLDSDKHVNRLLDRATLLKLSKQASGVHDPAMLALVPINRAYKGFPSMVSDDQGNCTLQFRLGARDSESHTRKLDLAIILVNPPNYGIED